MRVVLERDLPLFSCSDRGDPHVPVSAAIGEKGDVIAVGSGRRRQHLTGLAGELRCAFDVIRGVALERKTPQVEAHPYACRRDDAAAVRVGLLVPHVSRG